MLYVTKVGVAKGAVVVVVAASCAECGYFSGIKIRGIKDH
jgi:predicted Zn-ribbon and HTH transcriptional regulator